MLFHLKIHLKDSDKIILSYLERDSFDELKKSIEYISKYPIVDFVEVD